MREWIKTTLGKISKDNRGYYGIGAPAVDYNEDLYTYLRITDINDDGTLNKKDMKSVDEADAGKYLLAPNDIVFARTGNSTGRSYFYDGSDGDLVFAGFLIKFSLDEKKVNPKYMKYYTLSDDYKGWVKSFNAGSTRGNINANTYANMQLTLPPRYIQDNLVTILSSLDDKIENNRRICEKLEEMAQAIFKQWFVEFNFPDENGEPYKDNGGEMVESELGLIPKGWKVGTVSEIADFKNGKKKPDKNGNISIYGGNGIFGFTDEFNSDCGTIIIGRVGAYCGNIQYCHRQCWISDNAISAKSRTGHIGYLLNLLKRYDLHNMHIGSSHPLLTQTILNNIKTVIPPIHLLEKINTLMAMHIETIQCFDDENMKLSQTRDTLLPKLMSGEIDLEEDE